ncbi:MAG: FGGY-family carbohydrate kinase [Rhodospirillales bacterium]|nr:FGGY-family carbohydrate kinase [Rhodospirillales bacterium]
MSDGSLLLGVDIGSSGAKVGAFDARGRLSAKASVAYPTHTPRPGWVEQDPNAWWAACCRAIREVAAGVETRRIRGVSVVGLSPALVSVDQHGNVVCPAPIWSDQRSVAEIGELTERLGPIAGFSPLPRALWLRRAETDRYRQTCHFFESFDFISFMLTGEVVTVLPSGLPLPWSRDDIRDIGLDEEKFPTRLSPLGEVIGGVTPNASAETGLPVGLPVVSGTVDAFAAWVGTATLRRGELCNTVGTTDGVALVWDRPLEDPLGRVQSMPHIVERRGKRDWIFGGAMSSGGIVLDWFVRRFYEQVTDPYRVVSDEAASAPVGADGLLVLPYLVGERSPINDPDARGVFFGVGEGHRRSHFARAVLESVALAVRDVCEVIQEAGAQISQITVAGGASRSDVWNQIKADVIGKPLLVPSVSDSSLLGAAIIAGWGAGVFGNLSEGAETMVQHRARFEPNWTHHAHYTELLQFYRDLYRNLKSDFPRLARWARDRTD